jgi:hypothetical protein
MTGLRANNNEGAFMYLGMPITEEGALRLVCICKIPNTSLYAGMS